MAILALIRHKLSVLVATGLVGMALVAAGCGNSTAKSSHVPAHHNTPTSTTAGHHAPTATSASSGSTAGIPQGNGGDQDPDNNGGPSDGDGNI